MFKTVLSTFTSIVLVAVLFCASCVSAEDAVITISSLNDVQNKVCTAAGKINPNFPMLIQMLMGGQVMTFGLDADKPMALYATMGEKGDEIAAFIPVKNQKLFDAAIEGLKEKKQLDEETKIESKDGYAILLSNREWTEAVPKFETPAMLNVKLNPQILLPALAARTAAAELLKDDANREAQLANLKRLQHNIEQMKNFDFSLDCTQEGDILASFSATALEGTEVAENYAKSEKITKSLLCDFFDPEAPLAFQVLGAFDELNRRDLTEVLTRNAKISEELSDVILSAMEVKKFDLAGSFYPGKSSIYGILGMGINNGDKINASIVKAIQKNTNEAISGKANASTIGKNFTIHELTLGVGTENETNLAIAVHPKYLFLAVAPEETNAVSFLKENFQKRSLKAGNVEKNGQSIFDMALLKPFLNLVNEGENNVELKLAGKIKYVGEVKNGTIHGETTIESAVLESIGSIYSAIQDSSSDDSDESDDELFGDDDDDDDDEEEEEAEEADAAANEN